MSAWLCSCRQTLIEFIPMLIQVNISTATTHKHQIFGGFTLFTFNIRWKSYLSKYCFHNSVPDEVSAINSPWESFLSAGELCIYTEIKTRIKFGNLSWFYVSFWDIRSLRKWEPAPTLIHRKIKPHKRSIRPIQAFSFASSDPGT